MDFTRFVLVPLGLLEQLGLQLRFTRDEEVMESRGEVRWLERLTPTPGL